MHNNIQHTGHLAQQTSVTIRAGADRGGSYLSACSPVLAQVLCTFTHNRLITCFTSVTFCTTASIVHDTHPIFARWVTHNCKGIRISVGHDNSWYIYGRVQAIFTYRVYRLYDNAWCYYILYQYQLHAMIMRSPGADPEILHEGWLSGWLHMYVTILNCRGWLASIARPIPIVSCTNVKGGVASHPIHPPWISPWLIHALSLYQSIASVLSAH